MVEYRESADPAYPGVAVSTFQDVFARSGVPAPRRIGIAGYLVTTAPVLDSLRQAFPNAEIVRADSIMVALRSIKSPAEIACLKKAFQISEIAMDRAIAALRPGMTELQIVGLVQQAIYEHGAEYEGMPQYVLSGPNSRHAISRPTHRIIQPGDLVQLNLSARVGGYSSGVGVPVCVGKMSSAMRSLVEFGIEAHRKTVSWMKAGVVAADVARKYKQFFVDSGRADNFLYGPCHGLGMIEVEPPWMEEISEYPLLENMTFQADTFVCGAEYGLRWENGLRVTSDGVELFSGKYQAPVEIA
jgi:Xaa-Pro aminopeptidase